ncbi:MAG: hypothetical protein DHS20C16_08190 [Phycisphaerae bacterium]|nr:MAG: hypothetical protein DHS20C16_08190 [Phycisphaerae bacterium]
MIAFTPVIGVYVIVACYHLASVAGNGWMRESVKDTQGTVPHWKMAFIGILLISVVVWVFSLLFVAINAWNSIKQSRLRVWPRRVAAGLCAWCVLQPLCTSLFLPQSMSLLAVHPDEDAAAFIMLFRISRLPGFAIGLGVSFTLALLVFSLDSTTKSDQLERMKKEIKRGIWIFFVLILLGIVRVVIAQRAVVLVGSDPPNLPSVLNTEAMLFATYYGMMGAMVAIGSIFAFNTQVERLMGKLKLDHAFSLKDLRVAWAATLPIAVPLGKIIIEKLI